MSRSILVTGTSSGFGSLFVRTLAKAGHTIYAGMRNTASAHKLEAEALLAWAQENNANVHVVDLDVTCNESVAAAEAHIAQLGGIDTLIHNAGLAAAGLTETFSAEAARALFDVNVFGMIRVQQAFLGQLRRRPGARVVYVTSTLAREVMPFLVPYSASKHALDCMAEGWRYELNAIGIRTVIVQPGTFPTTGMITRLLPADAPQRAEAYGAFASAPEGLFAGLASMIASGNAPDPQMVADVMLTALADDAPVRIVVDPSGFDGASRLNTLAADIQAQVLGGFGMAALLNVQG